MGWIVLPSKIHMFKPSYQVPQNLTLFGDKVFKEVVKLNEITEVDPNTILLMSLKEKIRTQI